MSDLQLWLAIAGGLALIALVAHNAWHQRQNQPRQADPAQDDPQVAESAHSSRAPELFPQSQESKEHKEPHIDHSEAVATEQDSEPVMGSHANEPPWMEDTPRCEPAGSSHRVNKRYKPQRRFDRKQYASSSSRR